MASVTGPVENLKIIEGGFAYFKVDSTLFILWKFSEINFEQMLWFSLIKEAIAAGKNVLVTHPTGSAIPTMVQFNSA